MASEMRRMARSLIEVRAAAFASAYPRVEAEARVKAALAAIEPRQVRFERRWVEDAAGLALELEFHPAARTPAMLRIASLTLVALIAAAAWALLSDNVERALAFIATLAAGLWVLALPWVAAAFGAQREAEEARITRALERALRDGGESGGDRSR